jgi:hypothetical protein
VPPNVKRRQAGCCACSTARKAVAGHAGRPRAKGLVRALEPRLTLQADIAGPASVVKGQSTKSLRDSGGKVGLRRINEIRDRR